MNVGDILYEKVYDFATNINPGLTTFGGASAAWQAAGSLQISNAASQGGVIFSDAKSSGASDIEVEMLVTMSADSAARKHFGLWLLKAGASQPTGYRLFSLDAGSAGISRWASGTETPMATASWAGFTLNREYLVKGRQIGSEFTFWVDGVKLVTLTDTTYADMVPAVFDYGCTVQVKKLTVRHLATGLDVMLADPNLFKVHPMTCTVANQEPRAQFQPQDIAWRGSPGFVVAGPVPKLPITAKPLVQGRDYYWIRDGVRNVEQGYIESTVTINGIGVARRVLCFTQDGYLVGETMSRASDGKYRFDLLWLNQRYMLVAQDDPAFGPADYNAVAADFQLPTAYAPGEGVGLK